MSTRAQISVIIPIYNAISHLRQCVDSVCTQTFNDIEILLIDDGSTDGSVDLCNELAREDPRIKVILKGNDGVSATRNLGVALAKGEYVTFVDSDDWIDRNTCSIAISIARKHSADITLWPYVRHRGTLTRHKTILSGPTKHFSTAKELHDLHKAIIGPTGKDLARPQNLDSLATVWGKLYSMDLLRTVGAHFDTALTTSEDVLFNVRVFAKAKSVVYVDRYLYHYRRDNESSETSRFRPDLEAQWRHLTREIERVIDSNRLGPDFSEALQNRRALSIVGLGLNELASNSGPSGHIRQIDYFIQDSEYTRCIRALETSEMPIYWRGFFYLARHKHARGLYLLLLAMNALRRIQSPERPAHVP